MSKSISPFGLRLPPELKSWLTARTIENRRSLNSEIVKRLEDSRKAELQKADGQ